MDKFSVGETAVYQGNGARFPVGAEVEIISPEYSYRGNQAGYDIMVDGFPCSAADSINGEWHVSTPLLRKKKPPAGSLDELEKICNWRPEGVTV